MPVRGFTARLAETVSGLMKSPLAAVCLGLSVALISLLVFIQTQLELRTYQDRYGPALALACAGKFGALDTGAIPQPRRSEVEAEIRAFLREQGATRSFNCDRLPAEFRVSSISDYGPHLGFFYRFQVYQLAIVGALWSITGPNWVALELLTALLGTGALAGLVLLGSRFAGLGVAALVGTVVFFASSHNLQTLALTRDYTKALFITMGLAVLLWLLQRAQEGRARFFEPALLGALLGIGYGFRQDVVSTILISAVLILLFWGNRFSLRGFFMRGNFGQSLLAAASAVLGFLAFAIWPTIIVPVANAHEGHFFILGMLDSFITGAGWKLGDFSYNHSYEDISGYGLIEAYVIAETGKETVPLFSHEYNHGSLREFVQYLITFPHDLIGRVTRVITTITYLDSLVAAPFVILAALVLYLRNARILAVLIFYFCLTGAVLSLQFHWRHYFHAQMMAQTIVACILLGAVLQAEGRKTLFSLVDGDAIRRRFREVRASENSLVTYAPAIALACCLAVYFVTMGLQAASSARLLATIDKQDRVPIEEAVSTVEGGARLISFAGVKHLIDFRGKTMDAGHAKTLEMTGGYIELIFPGSAVCKVASISAEGKYEAPFQSFKPEFAITVPVLPEGSRLLFPAFYSKYTHFNGVRLNTVDEGCVPTARWIGGFDKIKLPVFYRGPVPPPPGG